ncbi:hypothetical protein ACLCDG_09790, partial [Coxiella burnetii]
TAFFSSKLIVDNKGGSINECSETKYVNCIISPYSASLHTGYFATRPPRRLRKPTLSIAPLVVI